LTNVRALRNGTMGWLLAGFQLESKPSRRRIGDSEAKRRHPDALSIAAEEKLTWITVDEFDRLFGRTRGRLSYRCAV
jgi:hypothetical protein